MAKTVFNEHNSVFSQSAHNAAQEQIYPKIWPGASINFVDVTIKNDSQNFINNTLDGDLGIDRILDVRKELATPIRFTIQERFRRPTSEDGVIKYYKYRDITITEWNEASDVKSELYKIQSDYFLYGYFNEKTNCFGEVILVDVPFLKTGIINNSLRWEGKKNKKMQRFICIKFDDLIHTPGCIYHKKFY
jgi:hypothetical protein